MRKNLTEVIDMLKEFSVSNFKSIKDEIFFSMESDSNRVSEFPEHLISVNNNKLLKVSSMYGPNGGGKTNILKALSLVKIVVTSGEETMIIPAQYNCAFSEDDVIKETMFFVDEEYEYGYQFEIKFKIEERQETDFLRERRVNYYAVVDIISETVSYKKKNEEGYIALLERNKEGYIKSEYLNNFILNIQLSKNNSILKHIYNNFANNDSQIEELNVIKNLYNQIVSITNLDPLRMISPNDLDFIDINKNSLIELLNRVDINIKDIKVYPEQRDQVVFVRELLVSDKPITTEISLRQESSGTIKVFFIFVDVLKSIKSNKIFYCNDMNSFLHPKMYRAIIELFNSDLNKNSQLIFNTHDILNMNNTLFRRDEIWFVFRDENYSTKLISLSNIVNYKGEQVRKDAKFYKQYLEGKFGADPFIKQGLNWGEVINDGTN